MSESKPIFIIKKYRSILRAAVVVESVSFIVSLTDGIVAGNLIGLRALEAIGLIAPFLSVSTFISSVINSGTVRNYSYHIGRFDRERAMDFYNQGICMAVLSGLLYAAALFVLRDFIVEGIALPGELQEYAGDYLGIIVLYFLINPLSYLLDNLVIADGGEKLSAGANVAFIISNVLLSYLFAGVWGIRGVALATVLSRLLLILIISLHFIGRRDTFRLSVRWNKKDCISIVKGGIVKASTYALEGVTIFAINVFAVSSFDAVTLVVLIMVEKYLGLLTLFIGLSMAAQPLIGTLMGENNTKALRYLMRTVCRDMILAGALLTVLTYIMTPFLIRAFGVFDAALVSEGVKALRIVSSTLVLQALLVLFFIYYYLIGRQRLAFEICVIKNVISPLFLSVLFSVLTGSHVGLWFGLGCAPLLSILLCSQLIYWRFSKKHSLGFPFLLPREADDDIYIYDFALTEANAVEMSHTADAVLAGRSASEKNRMLASLFLEEMLLLIREKNKGAKVNAEATIMIEPSGIRLVLRDSGVLFDITDEEAIMDSFRQYVVARLMSVHEEKAYMVTTGYNRNELLLPALPHGPDILRG